MANRSDITSPNRTETVKTDAVQVQVRMQQGEATVPLYANFSTVQVGQGIVIVDFGFLEPQILNALNRMSQSGEKIPETVNARLSCRMAMSNEAAHNLAQQLNQLFVRK